MSWFFLSFFVLIFLQQEKHQDSQQQKHQPYIRGINLSVRQGAQQYFAAPPYSDGAKCFVFSVLAPALFFFAFPCAWVELGRPKGGGKGSRTPQGFWCRGMSHPVSVARHCMTRFIDASNPQEVEQNEITQSKVPT